jgi:hypothetical protein
MSSSPSSSGDEPASAGASAAELAVERPPPGLARGEYDWPAWAIAAAGGSVVALGVAYLVWRYRKLLRK